MLLRRPHAFHTKRAAARLEGRTFGACHKCGGSFAGSRNPRACYCMTCGTLYHAYDCGKKMAAVGLLNNPEQCPKVSLDKFALVTQYIFQIVRDKTTHPAQIAQILFQLFSHCNGYLVFQRLSLRVRTPRVSPIQEEKTEQSTPGSHVKSFDPRAELGFITSGFVPANKPAIAHGCKSTLSVCLKGFFQSGRCLSAF